VTREPRREIGALDVAKLGASRRGRRDVALEELREEVLVDPFGERRRHDFTLRDPNPHRAAAHRCGLPRRDA